MSGGNSYRYCGYGKPKRETLIVVGFEGDYARRLFKPCQHGGTVTDSYHAKNEETKYHTGLNVGCEPRGPWSEMWQEMQCYQ